MDRLPQVRGGDLGGHDPHAVPGFRVTGHNHVQRPILCD